MQCRIASTSADHGYGSVVVVDDGSEGKLGEPRYTELVKVKGHRETRAGDVSR